MPKEKEEAIGITLLDVLTNSFAAALLLLTIVAATVGSGEGSDSQSQPGSGTDYVIAAQFGEDKKLERPDPPVVTALLTFKGKGSTNVALEINNVTEGEQVTVRKGLYRPEQWSIFRRGIMDNSWSVRFSSGSSIPDSVYVLVTIGNTGLAPVTLPVSSDVPLLEMDEPVKSDKNIKIFSIPIPSL